ncbi:MAG: starch-binding protein [Candidatus Izemoplasmatales bacterium]|jgi:hypothetical protein|nr:starch-binding protein [Candidatus Izemoplasmatales bacterium]
MKKIFLGLFLIFGLTIGFLNIDIKAEEPTGTTQVGYTYVLNLNGTQGTPVNLTTNYGTSVFFDRGTQENYEFVGYINQGKLISTLDQAISIRVTENTYVQYYFKPAGEVAVIFMDTNLNFQTIRYTDNDGETPTNKMVYNETYPLPLYTNFSKPGLSSTGWTRDGLTAIDFSTATFTSDTIVYPLYSTAVNNLTLSITDGTASVAGPYAFNQVVTVTANAAPENYTFSHWTKDGVIVSYDSNYTFTVAGDHTLKALYVLTTEYTAQTSSFVNVSAPYELKDGYQTLVGQFDLSDGETLVEYGFVHSNTEMNPTLSTANTEINYSNKYSSVTNEYVMSFSKFTQPIGEYYRSFVTTINASNIVTVTYSSVITNNTNTQVWFYNSDSWTNVQFNYWLGTNGTIWPGRQAIQDGSTDWWYLYIPLDLDSNGFNLIVNNVTLNPETGPRTKDILITDTSGTYVLSNGETYNDSTSALDSLSTTRIWFFNEQNWTTVKVHYFGDGVTATSWPGIDMIQDGTTKWWYYDLNYDTSIIPVTVVIHNNSGWQTYDTTINTQGYIYIVGNDVPGDKLDVYVTYIRNVE